MSGCRGITSELGHTLLNGRENARNNHVLVGARKTQVLENASMENACTENASTMQTFSQIKKSLVLYKLVWCIFEWGVQVDYRLFFLR